MARPDLPKHPAIDLMVKNGWYFSSIAKNSMIKKGKLWKDAIPAPDVEPATPLEHYAWQKISGHEMERLLLRDLEAMSAMNAEDYQQHAKELWSEAREVGKLTIASASVDDLEKISRMRIPRARGDKMLPPVDAYGDDTSREIRVTSSDKAKAKVKRMIKWLSLK